MWRKLHVRQWAVATMVAAVLGLVGSLPGQESLDPSLTKVEVTDQDDTEARLLKERYNAAVEEWTSLLALQKAGQITPANEQFLAAMTRVVASGLQLHRRPEDRLKLLEQYVKFAKAAEKATAAHAEEGRVPSQERFRTRYYRLDAELQLLREAKRMN